MRQWIPVVMHGAIYCAQMDTFSIAGFSISLVTVEVIDYRHK